MRFLLVTRPSGFRHVFDNGDFLILFPKSQKIADYLKVA